MLRHLYSLLLFVLLSGNAIAQRDPPLIDCYLPSITLTHAPGDKLLIDLVLKKETGPSEHREHQLYLLAYLLEDEAEILKIAATPELLDKTKPESTKLFLDVLLERGLVTLLQTQVAKRRGFAGQDNLGKYADGSQAGRDRESFLKLNTFAFSFSPSYVDLFDKVSKLKNFRNEDPPPNVDRIGTYQRRFKILVYVPVNDCKYATDVSEEIRGKHDFAFGAKDLASFTTPILYFRPLPYEFTFRRDNDVGTKVSVR